MTSGSRMPSADLGLWRTAVVTSCGLGLLRPASGSWGSLPPPALILACVWMGLPWWSVSALLALIAVLSTVGCIRYGDAAETSFGGKDPSSVVLDETAGCALTLLAVPWWLVLSANDGSLSRAALIAAVGFFFFRLFDVWKPGFVRDVQSQRGGWGIVLDDLAAGAWAWPPTIIACAVALRLFPATV
ncbi:MAG: phosphatidylglycerophosphatase A [Planctomycetes bacterium]|nr:phosphatidylglycerophosphatase A [Planctomycetota bacterium]